MRPPRLEGFSYRGPHRYLLTFCTKHRLDRFVEGTVVESARAAFWRTAEDLTFTIAAYCFMPNHVHLVIEGLTEASDLTAFASASKQRAAHALWKDHKMSKVWQAGHHDRIIRPEDDLNDAIRYVLENPVRAGLAKRWDQYPFSGSIYPPREITGGSLQISSGGP